MKKTYMVAMQAEVVLRPVVYMEVIADNAADALKQAKKEAKLKNNSFSERYSDQYQDEINTDFEYELPEAINRAKVFPLNVYPSRYLHSVESCMLCQKVKGSQVKKGKRK